MQMGRPGRNAWKNALRYAIRILYLRTTSGVLTLTDLLGLPVTQRSVSMLVYLVAALSLMLNQRKLTKSNQTGLQSQCLLFQNHPHDLQLLNLLPKMKIYQALLHRNTMQINEETWCIKIIAYVSRCYVFPHVGFHILLDYIL